MSRACEQYFTRGVLISSNAELAPAGIRGSLVALQQLAITFGILISYWIGYGTNCEWPRSFTRVGDVFV